MPQHFATSKYLITQTKWDNGSITIEISEEMVEEFKKVISRGMNTYERAPGELREFRDQLVEGRVLQDYSAMPKYTTTEQLRAADVSKPIAPSGEASAS